ncbi:MAG: helix-turn-helix domain-containing protein [Tannerella sp.]|nr:helix-turn-helix domain-containing protein [Tannerella sp.]
MKNRNIKGLAVLLWTLLSVAGYGRERVFRGITISDGLSDNLVNVIHRDSTGFVWIGTDNALNRFDGANIKKFYFDGTDAHNKRVTSIVEAGKTDLFIGNGSGLWRLDRMTETMQQILPEIIDMQVNTLLFDRHETLYAGTEEGLFRMDADNPEGSVRQILVDENVLSASNRIKSMVKDETGKIWLATSKGLFSYSPDSQGIENFNNAESVPRGEEYRTATLIGDTLYLGTETQGIFIFDTENHAFSKLGDPGGSVISSLSSDGMDKLYISTDGNGIYCFSTRENRILWQYRHDPQDVTSIRSNSVYSLLVDNMGIIWTGYYSAGLDYSLYQSPMFGVYAFPPAFDSENMTVRAFCNRAGEKLIGTRDGLYFVNATTGETVSFKDGILRSNLILSVAYYRSNYYIGTYGGGLYVLNPETLILSDFSAGNQINLPKGHVFCLYSDMYDNLWMGTSEGVFCYNGETGNVRNYHSANSKLPEGLVYEIFFDSTDKGWFCTQTGVCIFDRQTGVFKTNVFPANFPAAEDFRMIFEDSARNLYLLPDKGNIVKTDIKISDYQVLTGDIFNDYLYCSMIEDDSGDFWMGSNKGLVRISGSDTTIYGISDGLPDQLFLTKAVMKDPDGVLWFGNNKGLVIVDTEKIDSLSNSHNKLVFTDILLKDHPFDGKQMSGFLKTGVLKLKKNENTITFRFSNLMYSDPKTSVYEYRMEGIDNKWITITGSNEVTLYDLQPRQYVFRVRSLKNEATEASVNIRVGRSYTWLIWAGALLALSTVLFWALKKLKDLYRKIKSPENKDIVSEKNKYKSNSLSDDECKKLLAQLNAYMKSAKPYLDSELKISDISGAMKVSSPSLSFLFNQYLDTTFYDYINEFRINEFKALVAEKKHNNLTLDALSQRAGFSSRASFFRSFKKITGITPNEYVISEKKKYS